MKKKKIKIKPLNYEISYIYQRNILEDNYRKLERILPKDYLEDKNPKIYYRQREIDLADTDKGRLCFKKIAPNSELICYVEDVILMYYEGEGEGEEKGKYIAYSTIAKIAGVCEKYFLGLFIRYCANWDGFLNDTLTDIELKKRKNKNYFEKVAIDESTDLDGNNYFTKLDN